MRKMIGVAIVSAAVGAGLALWAQSAVLATGRPAVAASSVRISPHEIMRSATNLPVEVIDEMN
jgi:hypothetical protein